MPKPINWDLVTHLMRTYYPREYKRILAEQQTELPLPLHDTKGDTQSDTQHDTQYDTRNCRTRQKRKAAHHSR